MELVTIAGIGFLYHEMHTPDGSPGMQVPRHRFLKWNRVVIDPDADSIKTAKWIASEFVQPYWEWEREFQAPKGEYRKAATTSSANRSATIDDERGDWNRKRGEDRDLMCVWKVFSKAGMGHRASGPTDDPAADGAHGTPIPDGCGTPRRRSRSRP